MASDSRQELITKGPGLTRHPGLSASCVCIWLELTYLGVPTISGHIEQRVGVSCPLQGIPLGGAAPSSHKLRPSGDHIWAYVPNAGQWS
jgi:hypothetical protein